MPRVVSALFNNKAEGSFKIFRLLEVGNKFYSYEIPFFPEDIYFRTGTGNSEGSNGTYFSIGLCFLGAASFL